MFAPAQPEDENTEMIEVDPKLFITCRLCLVVMGVYQIVPTVQQQIKYCFDINVEPFDGLPQLLCKKCKVLLDDYSSNKKKFIEKQQCLITKLKVKQILEKLQVPARPPRRVIGRPTHPLQRRKSQQTLHLK